MQFTCEVCNKGFDKARQLIGHRTIHRPGGRYSVSRKSVKASKLHNCLLCDKEFSHRHTSTNKFCTHECGIKYKWEKETVPRIESGAGAHPRTLKKCLVEKRGEVCEQCNQGSTHNQKPLMLQLDHIDGNSDNNSLNNLRLLCPNCHTQTDTYGAKGQGVRYHKKNTKRNRYLQEYKS